MQFSAIVSRFIVKTELNSAFTNDLKRKEFFSKNVHSCRLCLFNNVWPGHGQSRFFYFNIFCKVKYSNEIYRPNNLMLQTKYQGHWSVGSRNILSVYHIWACGHCQVSLGQPRIIICENHIPTAAYHVPNLITSDFRDDFKGYTLLYGQGGHLGHVLINKWRFWFGLVSGRFPLKLEARCPLSLSIPH